MFKVLNLGKASYPVVYELQRTLFEAKVKRQKALQRIHKEAADKVAGSGNTADAALLGEVAAAHGFSAGLPSPIDDHVLFVEHTPQTYTMGKRDTSQGLLHRTGGADGSAEGQPSSGKREMGVSFAENDGIPVVSIRRGGGLTWHGPGQATIYPIVNVRALWQKSTQAKDVKGSSPVRWYTEVIENTMIRSARDRGIAAVPGKVGVWLEEPNGKEPEKKIGSVGLQLSDWVSMHGFAFNVRNELAPFDRIIMCELPDKRATNLIQALAAIGGEGSSSSPAQPTVESVGNDLLESLVASMHQPEGALRLDLCGGLTTEEAWALSPEAADKRVVSITKEIADSS